MIANPRLWVAEPVFEAGFVGCPVITDMVAVSIASYSVNRLCGSGFNPPRMGNI
jgi:hypothetical protein